MSARRAAAILLLACLAAGGCGIPLQDEAEPLPVGLLPTAQPSATPSQTVRATTLYFTNGRQLEGVAEPIASRSAEGILAALADGPPADRQAELRSLILDPLTGEPLLTVVAVTPLGQVTLMRSDAFLEVPAADQVLLIGQVVLSLDELGMAQVQIVDSLGAPVSISLPDGRTRVGPVTPRDFEELLIP